MQFVLFGLSVTLLCFVQAKSCGHCCMYFFAALVHACVDVCDGDVICVCYDLNRCSGWWYVCSVNVKLCWLKDATLWNASFELTL